MESAHRLTLRNIRVKININLSKGSGDMERTQNSRVNHMTLKCDLDIESAYVTFDGSTYRLTERNLWVKLNENRSKCSGDM